MPPVGFSAVYAPPRGLEHPPQTPEKTADPQPGGAESGALPTLSPKTDPELFALIDAWADLSEPVRRGILAMVEAAKGEGA